MSLSVNRSCTLVVLQDPPLPATITCQLEHNHQTQCADALRQLRMSEETRHLFMDYFNDGLSPAMAMSLHESKTLVTSADFLSVHLSATCVCMVLTCVCMVLETILGNDIRYNMNVPLIPCTSIKT